MTQAVEFRYRPFTFEKDEHGELAITFNNGVDEDYAYLSKDYALRLRDWLTKTFDRREDDKQANAQRGGAVCETVPIRTASSRPASTHDQRND